MTKRGKAISQKQDLKIKENKSIEIDAKSERPEEQKTKPTARALIAELVFALVLLMAICALRTVHLYANNVSETTFAALGKTMWIFMGGSVAAFAVLRIFLRKPYFACIYIAFVTFLAVNFSILVDLMRVFVNKYNQAALGAIILFVILLVGFFFLLRLLYKKKLPMNIVAKVLAITFVCLVIFNVVLALIAVGKIEPEAPLDDITMQTIAPTATAVATGETTPQPSAAESTAQTTPAATVEPLGQPNIYYFILDEYGTFDIMSKYYGYSNGVFYDFLKTNGFNISRESYSSDTQTEQSIADILNLDYISRHLSKSESTEYIAKAKLYSIFTDLGYSQFQYSIDTRHFKSIVSLDSDTGTKEYEEIVNLFGDEEADSIVSDNSISDAFSELLGGGDVDSIADVDSDDLNEWDFYPSEYIRNTKAYKDHDLGGYADDVLKIFDYFEDANNYADTTPRVTYSYMTSSHVPFIFNEYGGLISYSQSRDWENTDVYLNQYKFITKHMMATLSTIIENDPNSIILVMSDHGIRYHADCNRKHTFYINDKDSLRIINAVYIKGQPYDIEGLSAINTVRFVLSLYDGLDYPPIEDPVTADSPDSLVGIIPKPR